MEEYNGTSWTETTDINTPKAGMGGSGTTALAIVFGGSTPSKSNETEYWDGSTWAQLATQATARDAGASAGTASTAALWIMGAQPGYATTVEEWTVGDAAQTVTTS